MNATKIVGLIGVLLAIVAAFVAIPYAAAILLIIGLFVGLSIIPDHHVRVIVSALALATLSHSFDAIPQVGSYISTILSNLGVLAAGAALMIILRNMYARFRP
ncbi:MAG TPA: hypothetical protein VKB41_01545 [Steroidobacteraceae bacterium]|jgi:hypothetical protein|nr:hypothetical protein [Steroidobacteraceae bacterium]